MFRKRAPKRTRIVSIGVIAMLTVVAGLVAASAGSAAKTVDARLDGTAKVKLKLTREDLNPSEAGEVLDRKYKFTSSCAGDRACSEVGLKRELSDGSFQPLTLKRVKKGVYEYDESSTGEYWCTRNGQQVEGTKITGPSQTTITIKITKSKDEEATEFAAALKFVRAPFTGWADQECAAEAESRGLEVGERPEQRSKGTGKF